MRLRLDYKLLKPCPDNLKESPARLERQHFPIGGSQRKHASLVFALPTTLKRLAITQQCHRPITLKLNIQRFLFTKIFLRKEIYLIVIGTDDNDIRKSQLLASERIGMWNIISPTKVIATEWIIAPGNMRFGIIESGNRSR